MNDTLTPASNLSCPLCGSLFVADLFRDKRRKYFRCGECSLAFADPAARLSALEERAIYDLHQNDPQDPGYRSFLGRLAAPLIRRLGDRKLHGLDFGCGPGPTLSLMLEDEGHLMTLYDPFFYPTTDLLSRQYDFITCTEAIEHFNNPAEEWHRLMSMLKPCGVLAIMTKLLIEPARFAQWTYKNDPTHVSFFSRATFEFLARRHGLECEFPAQDVVFLVKNAPVAG